MRILIVEDQPDLSREICQRIKGFGYILAGCAQTGSEAIKKAKPSNPIWFWWMSVWKVKWEEEIKENYPYQ